MHQVTLADGSTVEAECLSCDIVSGRRGRNVDAILETPSVHVHQDVAYPVPGFAIVALRRHVRLLDELDDTEATGLMDAVRRVRAAQRAALDVEHVYLFYNEDTRHHLHLWMAPRWPWMEEFGRSIESLRPALNHARQTASDAQHRLVREAADALRRELGRRAPTRQ